MAKRKRSSVRRSFPRYARRRSHKSGVSAGGITGVAVGTGLYLLYKAYLASKIPLTGVALSGVEAVGGYMLSKKGGFIGDFGKATFYLGTFGLMSQLIAPIIIGGVSASSEGGAF